MAKRKRKLASDYDLEDLVKFERFISGKNGDYRYEELEDFLTYARLDSLIEGTSAERQSLLVNNYESSLKDPDRLGYIILQVYDDVFRGNTGRLPNGIYEGRQGKLNFKFMLRYAIAAKKKWRKEDVPAMITKDIMRELKLGRGLDRLFRNSPTEAVMFCYPELSLKEWYFGNCTENIWYKKDAEGNPVLDDKKRPVVAYAKTSEAIAEFAGAWLARKTEDEIKTALEIEKGTSFEGKRVSGKPAILLADMVADDFSLPILPYGGNLKNMMKVCFGDCPSGAITSAFPDIPFKEHYFRSAPNTYWVLERGVPNIENITSATREFCELWLDGRHISELAKLRHEDFELPLFPGRKTATGMLRACLNRECFSSYRDIVVAAYPGQFEVVDCRETGRRQKKLAYAGSRQQE